MEPLVLRSQQPGHAHWVLPRGSLIPSSGACCSPGLLASCCPMGKPKWCWHCCPKGASEGSALQFLLARGSERHPWVKPCQRSQDPTRTAQRTGGWSEPWKDTAAQLTLQIGEFLAEAQPPQRQQPPRASFGAAPTLSRWVLVVLVQHWVLVPPSSPNQAAEHPWCQRSPTFGTAPWHHQTTGGLANPNANGDPSPMPSTPRLLGAPRCWGVIGCSSTCCRAALILLQVAAIQCRIYSALTLSCQEGTARLMGWAGSCNNRLFDVTSLIGVDLLTD